RPFDREANLGAVHLRDEVLAIIDGLGKSGELRAFPEKIGAHRQQDVDGSLLLLGGVEEKADEPVAFLLECVGSLSIPEDLLELINDDEEVVSLIQSRLTDGLE